MKAKTVFTIACVFAVLMASCTKDEVVSSSISKESVTGLIQKGPFVNGSTISMYELTKSFSPSGKVYDTQIQDNKGSFAFQNIELASRYVKLKADGFYFNEVSGAKSASQITLYAIADLRDKSTVNVNVLTHLERNRVEYLVNSGLSFNVAKKQAQKEVLSIFNLEINADSSSESLNLSAKGASNGVLLAVSSILQGRMTTADMAELMADIITDITPDGKLDNVALGSKLIDNAKMIDLATVRNNLVTKYLELGFAGEKIPDFEQYVNKFITDTKFVRVKIITYPTTGSYGTNILCDTVSVLNPMQFYSMTANLPEGTSLKVVIKGGLWWYVSMPAPTNWAVNIYNGTSKEQTFTIIESNKPNDVKIEFEINNDLILEFYENGAIIPTKVNHLKIK